MLKQTFLDRIHILFHVTKHVCVFEHLAAKRDLLCGRAKEFEFAHRVMFDVVQQLCLVHDDGSQSPDHLLRLGVVLEAREEENVAVQFLFCVFRCLVRSLEFLRVFDRLILVAFVVAAGRLVVVLPIAHAHPAKLVLADFACHMVTTAIFLDRPLAVPFRAHLRVRHNPSQILALRRTLALPVFVHFAV